MVKKVVSYWNSGELSSTIKWGIWPLICLVTAVVLIVYRNVFPDWFVVPPNIWTEQLPLPYIAFDNRMPVAMDWSGTNLADWFNAIIHFLRKHEFFDLFTFRDITRALAQLVVWPLNFAENLLVSGFRDLGIPGIPWIISAGLAAVLGWYLKGWRLSLLSGVCIAFFAIFGLWQLAMTTLSLILVTAPIAIAIGIGLGILANKWRWFERLLWPVLNLMQSLPHF